MTKKKRVRVPQRNAKDFLPEPLVKRVKAVIKSVDFARRITFYAKGDYSDTEKILGDELAQECRSFLKQHAPIRLYFGTVSKRRGRPPLPFRDQAIDLVSKGNRVEVVAAFFATRRQTLQSWGLTQPPKSRQPEISDDEFGRLFDLGLDHMRDHGEPELSDAEGIARVYDCRSPSLARQLIARVGHLVDNLPESVT